MRWAVLATALLLAGCTEPDAAPSPGDDADSAPLPLEELVGNQTRIDGIERPSQVEFTDCNGWQTGAYWVGPSPPPSNPPEWEPGVPAGSRVVMEAWECQRINLGPYERGPVRMVLEYTDRVDPPASCQPADAPSYALLSWGIDDDAVATYLGVTGAPTYTVNIDVNQESLGQLTQHTWQWGPNGSEPSIITIVDDDDSVAAGRPAFQFFWASNDTGVAGMRFNYDGQEPRYGERLAYGQLRQPMHLAASLPQHASPGAWLPNTSIEGKFQYWSDRECGN